MGIENFDANPRKQSRDTSAENPQLNERGPELYEYYLGVSPTEFSGKKVLNIGSGKTGLFEKALAQNNANVFTISPYFADQGMGGEKMREEYSTKPIFNTLRKKFDLPGAQQDIHAVASRVDQGVPFADSSMDYVVGLYSVPLYLETDAEKNLLISEIARVLRENGKAVLYPIPESQEGFFADFLSKYDLTFSFVNVPEVSDVVYPNEKTYRLEISK